MNDNFEFPNTDTSEFSRTGIEVKGTSNRRTIIIAILAGVLALVIVGGVFAFSKLSGGGVQPEELLPADTIAFAKLDLNPSFGQKIEFVRFISHFPSTFKNFDSNDPIGSVFHKFTQASTLNWDEIKPWIGNRFAIAGVQGVNGVAPVLVLAISDEPQMKYYFAKHQPAFKYVIKQGYAIIADTQATLDIVAASPKHLNSNATYNSDIAALGGSQVAILWGDLKPLLNAAGSRIDSLTANHGLGSITNAIRNTNGRIVLGFHFSSNSLAATFLTRGTGTLNNALFTSGETDLGNLPAETLASLSIAGIGDYLSKSIGTNTTVRDALDLVGISADQLKALLSGPLTIVILPSTAKGGTPLLALKLTPKDKSGALAGFHALMKGNSVFASIASQVVTVGSDIYVGTDAASLSSVISTITNAKSHLRDSNLYRQAIPNPGVLLAYLNLQQLLPTLKVTGDALKLGIFSLVTAEDKSQPDSTKTIIAVTLK